MRAQVVLFDGFDPLDVIAPYEVLWEGGLASDGVLTLELASAEGARSVVSGLGMVLQASATLDPDADILVVPGAVGRVNQPVDGPEVDTIPVLLARTVETQLPVLVKQALENGRTLVATVCGGGLALAMAGLLEGRHVVTHHLGMDLLEATGAIAVHARVVDDGNLVSAGGVTSGLDLGLYLLERELGPRVAHAVEEMFAYERRGVVWRNVGLEVAAL